MCTLKLSNQRRLVRGVSAQTGAVSQRKTKTPQ